MSPRLPGTTGLMIVSLMDIRIQQEMLVPNKNEFRFGNVDFEVKLDGQVLELKPGIEVHSFIHSFCTLLSNRSTERSKTHFLPLKKLIV